MAQSPAPVGEVALGSTGAAAADDGGGAVFDFSDLQALREEYEERIARIERERDATVDVMRRDADNRLLALKQSHEQQLATDAKMRQDLIEELTIELANAREEGEMRAMESDKRRMVAEAGLHIAKNEYLAQLSSLRNDVARTEADLARIRESLDVALTPVAAPPPAAPAPAPVSPSMAQAVARVAASNAAQAPAPASAAFPVSPTNPVVAATSGLPRTATPPPVPLDGGAAVRKRKIRLR